MARSHAAARPTLRFPCQSQPRPEPRERPPAGDAGTSAAHKAPPPLRLHSERLHVNNMCLAPTSRPSHLHDRGRRSKTRRGRRLCFAVLTLSQAQSGSEALGKIWQLFVFVSVCVCSCVCSGACCCVCCSSIQRSLVTLGAASKPNCSARRVNHGSCFGHIGYTFIDIWEIIFFLCCRHTHTNWLRLFVDAFLSQTELEQFYRTCSKITHKQ